MKESFEQYLMHRFVYLRFQVKPVLAFFELSFAINNSVICKKTVFLDGMSRLAPNTTLGSDLLGRAKTAFLIAEMLMYSRAKTDTENLGMWNYFERKFALSQDARQASGSLKRTTPNENI
jgi:hypothetical protein